MDTFQQKTGSSFKMDGRANKLEFLGQQHIKQNV